MNHYYVEKYPRGIIIGNKEINNEDLKQNPEVAGWKKKKK